MGKVIGFEMNSQNPEEATSFYSNVFGWEISEPHWDYQTIKMETGIEGGIAKGPKDFPHGIRLQIEVDSIEDAILKAV